MPVKTRGIDLGDIDGVRDLITRAVLAVAIRQEAPERGFTPFRRFVREGWHVIEPGTILSWNWHMDHICDHLEAIAFGVLGRFAEWQPYDGRPALTPARYERIRNLLINVPPRSSKSTIISVMWPAWAWAEVDPALRFLYASYAEPLALDHSRLCRDVIKSEWYQDRYADRFQIKHDHDTASDFANTKGGRRQAVGIGSATTGKGGHILVADDPHNVIDGESEADRAKVKRWYGQAFSTRLNNPATGAKVVVMQRIHTEDLSGVLLNEGENAGESKWERLIYRQKYEPERAEDGAIIPSRETALGYQDIRTEPDELLWPERFTPAVVHNAEVELGEYGFAGQHQQRPSPLSGGLFKRGWWQRYAPAALERVRFRRLAIFADTAQKAEERHDYSVFVLAGFDSLNDFYLLDLIRGRWEYPDLLGVAYDFWAKCSKVHGAALPLVIEDKGSGISLIQSLRRGEIVRDPSAPERMAQRRPKIPALGFGAEHKQLAQFLRLDKATRGLAVSPLVQAARVFLPDGAAWVSDFLAETEVFPNGVHDDQVDALVMALKWLEAAVQGAKVLRGSN